MSKEYTSTRLIATIAGKEYVEKTRTVEREFVGYWIGQPSDYYATKRWASTEISSSSPGSGSHHDSCNKLLQVIETVEKSANTRIQRLESDIVRYERMVKELRERIEVLEMKQELEQKQNEFENWFMETHSFELPE